MYIAEYDEAEKRLIVTDIYQPAKLLKWHTTEEKPESDCMCVVINRIGSKYFARPQNGKFMPDIRYWLPLPAEPEDNG